MTPYKHFITYLVQAVLLMSIGFALWNIYYEIKDFVADWKESIRREK